MVGARLGIERTLLSVRSAQTAPELVWSADGRRFAIMHGDPGRQRIVVVEASGEVLRRITPRQPVGPAAAVAALGISSGGTVLSWSYAGYDGPPFVDAEGVYFHDVARRRTCRRARPDQDVWWSTVEFAPDDRYAVIIDGEVRGLVPLRRPGRLTRVRLSPEGSYASNVQFLRRSRTTVDTKPCRAS